MGTLRHLGAPWTSPTDAAARRDELRKHVVVLVVLLALGLGLAVGWVVLGLVPVGVSAGGGGAGRARRASGMEGYLGGHWNAQDI